MRMKEGFDLLLPSTGYTETVIRDFEYVLGKFPTDYRELLMNYKTGYPGILSPEDYEPIAVTGKDDIFYVEAFLTLPQVVSRLYHFLDSEYGLSGNHREYRLLPICSAGSARREYYLKLDTGEVFDIDPFDDINREINLADHLIASSVREFILSFRLVKI